METEARAAPVRHVVCPECRRGTVQALPTDQGRGDLLLSLGSCD